MEGIACGWSNEAWPYLALRGWYKVISVFVNQLTREFSYNLFYHYNYLSFFPVLLLCLVTQSHIGYELRRTMGYLITLEDKVLPRQLRLVSHVLCEVFFNRCDRSKQDHQWMMQCRNHQDGNQGLVWKPPRVAEREWNC